MSPGASSRSPRRFSSSAWLQASSAASSSPVGAKTILTATLGASFVVLGLLLFGQSMIGEHDSVASLFTYGGVTLLMMGAVAVLSPGGRFWSRDS